jgi:ABC-type Fe3+/spermidine/putrescine transport system ATPase subunit
VKKKLNRMSKMIQYKEKNLRHPTHLSGGNGSTDPIVRESQKKA